MSYAPLLLVACVSWANQVPSASPSPPPEASASSSPAAVPSSPMPDTAPATSEPHGVPTPPTAPVVGPRVTSLRLALADPQPGELERLEAYLKDVLGAPAGPGLVADVSRRLDLLGRYGAPLCRTEPLDETRVVLSCTVRRARVLRRVTFDSAEPSVVEGVSTGLPLAILESELKKRVLLRPGEPIDDDDTLGRGRIARQRARIEDFLEREGFYGAQVIIKVSEPNEDGEVDVNVKIRGGSFVHVRRVNIESFGPFSQNRLIRAFDSMCLTSEGLVDGFFIDGLDVWQLGRCFNHRRLQSTIDRFGAELQELGYPEGRLRVTPVFLDARSSSGDDECAFTRKQIVDLTAARLPIPPRCVDLNVEVLAGRNIVTRFHVENDNQVVKDWPIVGRWLRETFGEPSSRVWQLTFASPIEESSDTSLVEADLQKRLTFNDAASVDVTEANLSRDQVLEYLNERGYPAPAADVNYVEYQDGSVAVDYYLKPGTPTPTRGVRFVGNRIMSSEAIFDAVELAARPRSFSVTGFVTARDLDDDVTRLRTWYGTQGFPEADISVHATRSEAGEVDVVFVVEEGDQFLVSDVILDGGDPALTPAILRTIAQCGGTNERRSAPEPQVGTDCAGSPLLPTDFDGDVRRVEAIYAGNGYPDAQAAIELGFSPKGPLVRISVFPFNAEGEARANPKPGNVEPLKLGQIFVEGNLKTGRDVLLREMGLDNAVSGTRLNPNQIALGVSRLRRTGLFSRVDVQLVGLDDHDDTAHVRVTVEERPTSTVDMSLGFSTEQFFSLRLEGRDRNLLGTMFDGSASADLGLFIGRFSQVRTQIRWPRMFGTDLTLSYTPISLSFVDQPAGIILQSPSTGGGQKAAASWDAPDARRRLFTASTSVALDWRAANIAPIIDDKLTVGVALEARGDWLQVAGPYIEPLSIRSLETIDGLSTLFAGDAAVSPASIFAVTPRVAYSTIDNPFDPKSGVGAELFVRTVPFAVAPYGVVGAQGRSYFSFLGDRLTLASNLRLRVGVVGDVGTCPVEGERCEWALMQNDLLRLGGERTIRGVGLEQVGIFGSKLDQNFGQSFDDQGDAFSGIRPGLFGAVANVELRFTLIRQLFLGDLKPAIFMDAGFSTDDFAFAPKDTDAFFADTRYAISFGTGLRYVLPVGPLALDFAWSPFDKSSSTLPFQTSLTLGYIF